MREIIDEYAGDIYTGEEHGKDEYAGILVGGIAAVTILGMASEFVLGGAGLHEIILSFSRSIC